MIAINYNFPRNLFTVKPVNSYRTSKEMRWMLARMEWLSLWTECCELAEELTQMCEILSDIAYDSGFAERYLRALRDDRYDRVRYGDREPLRIQHSSHEYWSKGSQQLAVLEMLLSLRMKSVYYLDLWARQEKAWDEYKFAEGKFNGQPPLFN